VRRLVPAALSLFVTFVFSGVALAHDDPIVTVRILSNGFNVLDMDAVLGEISDAATLSVDRPVHGASEIQAWVREQMDHDLRIEIVDIGTPQRLPDGYTLTWVARFSREDWRRAGVPARSVSNDVTIRNGRITNWTASTADATPPSPPAQAPASAAASNSSVNNAPKSSGVPEVFGVPLTLLLAIVVVAFAGVWMTRRFVR
jgi:hypothetical protein